MRKVETPPTRTAATTAQTANAFRCLTKKLFAAAAGILNDPQRMETMSQNMAALGIPDATKRIYDTVMTLLK